VLKKFVLIIVLTCCWTLSLADSQGLTISDFLVKSGTEKQLEGVPKSLKVGLKRGLARAPNPDEEAKRAFRRVEGAIDKAYRKDKMMKLLQQHLEGAFTPEELETMGHYLDSTLGKRFTEAANKMADEKTIEYIFQNSPKIMKEANKDPERLKIIQSLIEEMNTVENTLDAALDVSLATQIALFNATPGRQTPPMEVLEKNIEQQRFTMRGIITQLTLASSVYMSRPFSNAELKEDNKFSSSPVAKKFSRVMSAAMRKVNKQCAEGMGEIAAKAAQRSGDS